MAKHQHQHIYSKFKIFWRIKYACSLQLYFHTSCEQAILYYYEHSRKMNLHFKIKSIMQFSILHNQAAALFHLHIAMHCSIKWALQIRRLKLVYNKHKIIRKKYGKLKYKH